jgi:hypothetical protein
MIPTTKKWSKIVEQNFTMVECVHQWQSQEDSTLGYFWLSTLGCTWLF